MFLYCLIYKTVFNFALVLGCP